VSCIRNSSREQRLKNFISNCRASTGAIIQISEGEKQKASDSKTNLRKSRFSAQFIAAVLATALAEVALTLLVTSALLQSSHDAEHDFILLKSSAELGAVLESAQFYWDQANRTRLYPNKEDHAVYSQKKSALLCNVENVSSLLSRANITNEVSEKVTKDVSVVDRQVEELYQRKLNGDNTIMKADQWMAKTQGSLRHLIELIANTQSLVIDHPSSFAASRSTASHLIHAALAFNLILALLGFYLIRFFIALPIERLRLRVEHLMEGPETQKVTGAPGQSLLSNELTQLERTFASLAQALSEAGKKRKSFEAIFRTMLWDRVESINNALKVVSLAREQADSVESNDSHRLLSRFKASLKELSLILNSLLALPDERAPYIAVNVRENDVSPVLESSIASVHPLLEIKQVQITENVQHITAFLDPELIQRVITNLLSNAIKFSPKNGTIILEAKDEGASWRLSVKDQGPGIAPSQRKKLFTKFGKLKDTGPQREGTGLGLAICKEIVEAHGGVISCDTGGGGSTFWFSIPKSGRPALTNQTTLTATTNAERQRAQSHTSSSRYFIALLVVSLSAQTILIAFLEIKLHEIEVQDQIFLRQRTRLFSTEKLFGQMIKNRMQVMDGYTAQNEQSMKEAFKHFQSDFALTQKLEKHITAQDEAHNVPDQIKQIVQSEERLANLAQAQSPDEPSDLELIIAYPKAKAALHKLQTACLKLIEVDKQSVSETYNASAWLQRQLSLLLAITLIIDVTVFALAVRYAVILVERVKELTAKAAEFEHGNLPRSTTKESGADDLTWLDARFCTVSAEIDDLNKRRQTQIAAVSHDVRTPINSMMLTLESMKTEAKAGNDRIRNEQYAEIKAILSDIFYKANNFLQLERLENSDISRQKETLAFEEIIEGVIDLTQSKGLISKGRAVYEPVDSENDWIVSGNRELLESMLLQLLLNAARHAGKETPIRLRLHAKKPQFMQLDVISCGTIIEPDAVPQLFERYRDTTINHAAGLGLPLASKIAAVHGGSLELASNYTESVVFRVTMPTAKLQS
jgi:signal transduction histidine kinase